MNYVVCGVVEVFDFHFLFGLKVGLSLGECFFDVNVSIVSLPFAIFFYYVI